ncbi:MAG: cell division protein FtsA [Clostridia bacterium]|nr:cell division protein FtsA [Clostridia bacterium]
MAIGDIIVGLDIGVSKVSCVIGQVNKFSEIEVIGYGLSNNSGIKRGQILDYERVGQSIRDAVNSAEQISELSVNSAYVNIKGMNVRIEKVVMESEVERPNDGMTVNDIYNLYTKIQISTRLERDEQIIDILPSAYVVNGRLYKEEPIGAFCKTFQMEVEVVIAKGDYIVGVQKALKYAGLKIDGLILETLATSNIILMPEEKQNGVLMIDIGGGHTDISLYKRDRLEFYTTLPVGGNHITNDIALTFDINTEEAEKLKRQYNLALVSMITNNHEIKLTSKAAGTNDVVKCSEIVQVIEARIKEIYQLTRRMLQEKGMITAINTVVLTGQGISNIVGAEELATRTLKINQVRVCSPKLINVIKPQHTTVYGMVRYISGLGLSKHVNSDVQIVTEPSFKDKIFEGIENFKEKFFSSKKKKKKKF